jgi:hypothetical protein
VGVADADAADADASAPLGQLGAPCSHVTVVGTPSTECITDLVCEAAGLPVPYRCTRPCVFDSDSAADDPACQDSGGILTGRCIHEQPGDPSYPAYCATSN